MHYAAFGVTVDTRPKHLWWVLVVAQLNVSMFPILDWHHVHYSKYHTTYRGGLQDGKSSDIQSFLKLA